MSPVARIAAFAALLAVVFVAAIFAGSEIDPGVDGSVDHDPAPGERTSRGEDDGDGGH